MDIIYEVDIKTENLWDPFLISGPVSAYAHTFAGWFELTVEEITNQGGRWPVWFNIDQCGRDLGDIPKPFQLWEVALFTVDAGGSMGYYWVCEDVTTYSPTFKVEVTNLERKTDCTYITRDASASQATLTFEYCMDLNGAPQVLTFTYPLSDAGIVDDDEINLNGSFSGCLHKGTKGNPYITQEMSCNVYPSINISDWDELFGGQLYRAYGDLAIAHWDCIASGSGNACADHVWTCELKSGSVSMDRDPLDVEWLTWIADDDIKLIHRTTGLTTWSAPVVVDATGLYDYADISHSGALVIIVARRTSDHVPCEFYSRDRGETWNGPHVIA